LFCPVSRIGAATREQMEAILLQYA
jgi:hypothetical protein